MRDLTNIKIAVDFDGTIVEHEYPAIGKEKLFAFITLRELQKRGALAHPLDLQNRDRNLTKPLNTAVQTALNFMPSTVTIRKRNGRRIHPER